MAPLFPFAQFEFTHSIGPPAGRYILGARAEDDAEVVGSADVLVVRTTGAPAARRGLLRRTGRSADSGAAPREVPVVTATVVRGTQLLDTPQAAKAFLAGLGEDAAQETFIASALTVVNGAIAAYRASAADPYVTEVSRNDPRSVRVGYGIAEEVFSGRWSEAITVLLPAVRMPRAVQLMPQQALAHALAGQGAPLESETLVLGALRDHEQGRERAAAAGLQAAVTLLLGEVGGETLPPGAAAACERLIGEREAIAQLAQAAGRGPLDEAQVARVGELLELAGEVVDRRRYEPLGF